jgi:hypothetical protein
MEQKRNSAEGKRIVEEFERSGLKRRQFCERNNLSVTILDYWRGRKAKAAKPQLVKVSVENEEPSPGCSVVLPNGRCIESPWNFRDAELARLIRVVASA